MRNQLILIVVMAVWCLGGGPAHGADTTVSYQGRLDDGGSAAEGPYDMTFTLWDALAGGAQVGLSLAFLDVPVSEGLFTVELDFGADAFDNSARWLEIIVEGTTLSPRQPITRAPYAIQTRGIFVDENNHVGIGTTAPRTSLDVFDGGGGSRGAIQVETNAKTGLRVVTQDGSHAIRAENLRPSGTTYQAIFGFAVGSDATTIRGDSTGARGKGVVGWAQDTTSLNYGVWGRSDSTSGRGVYGRASAGTGTNYGVYGQNSSTSGFGVFGHNNASTGTTYGAYGRADSDTGRGTYGYAPHSTGINYGVVGRSDSPNGFDFFASGTGTNYGAFSSRRWKNNVVNIDNPLDKLARLRGVYFEWDDEHGGQHDVGMIAEEVGMVLPEIVNYEENGIDAIGMDYSKMTPLLVEAVNALRAKQDRDITTMREAHAAEISDLRQQLVDLQQVIEWLASTQEKESAQ